MCRERVGKTRLAFLPCVLALACTNAAKHAPSSARTDAGHALRVKPRFVSVEVLPVVEQTMSVGADGVTVLGALMPIAGVEVCPWKARPLLGALEDFVDLDRPCQLTDDMGNVAAFDQLPASQRSRHAGSEHLPLQRSIATHASSSRQFARASLHMLATHVSHALRTLRSGNAGSRGTATSATPASWTYSAPRSLLQPTSVQPSSPTIALARLTAKLRLTSVL